MDGEAEISRREFAIGTVAVGLAASASAEAADAPGIMAMPVDVKTPDGTCDAVLVHGAKPGAAVILYPDALGLRPVKVEMAKRLAAEGYTVLVVNSFYRTKRAPVVPAGFSFSNPDQRAELMKMMGTLNHETAMRDGAAFVDFLSGQPMVNAKKKMGSVGFCMGGAMTIRTAAARPDRVGACASFHGGGLVSNDPNSPHKLIAKTKAAYHFGIAAGDDAQDPNAKVALAEALKAAKRPYTLEVYPGTKHGWTVPDSEVYDKPQAERAWAAMTKLYKNALV